MSSITPSTATITSSYLRPQARLLPLSPTLRINELVAIQRAKGHSVVHLGFGEATFPLPPSVLAAHRAASQSTSYLPVAGLFKLRESIATFQSRRLETEIKPEQVVIAPGSKPLLFALFDVLEGDVLLPRPSWVSYEPQVRHAGKRVVWVETGEKERHSISEKSLRTAYVTARADGADPRVMLINSPSNPTGQVYSEENIEMLARFCAERGIVLISDEIYSDICFDETDHSSACAAGRFEKGKMIMTGGLSKTYSAGGWRVGFAIFPNSEFGTAVQSSILGYASECWSAASAPAQEAAALAFQPSPEMDLYRKQVTAVHRHCTLRLFEALKDCGLAIARPRGAFYLYHSFHPYTAQLEKLGVRTAADLAHWLIEECGVAALPGSAFGEDDDGLQGGRYRLRMATSYLYFKDDAERYEHGYELLEQALAAKQDLNLPLLEEAIRAIRTAVDKLRSAE